MGDEEDELVDVEAEVKLELELLCAAAYIPDRPLLVIINPNNVDEIRRTETFVGDLFLCITCNLARMKYKYIMYIDHVHGLLLLNRRRLLLLLLIQKIQINRRGRKPAGEGRKKSMIKKSESTAYITNTVQSCNLVLLLTCSFVLARLMNLRFIHL